MDEKQLDAWAFTHAGDSISILDETGCIVDANPAAAHAVGATRESLISQSIFTFLHPDDASAAKQKLSTLFAEPGTSITLELRVRQQNGTWLWVRCTGTVAADPGGRKLAVLVTHDNTREHEAQKERDAQQHALELYQLAVEHATNHIIITDPDGAVIFANHGVEEITGYPIAEIIGNTPRLWGRQMPKEFYVDFWKTIKTDLHSFSGIVKNKRKNGDIYWARATVSPIVKQGVLMGFIGVEEDITETRKIEVARAKAEARFSAFMNHSPVLAWMKDSSFHHVYINEPFSSFFRVTIDDIKTKTDTDLFSAEIAAVLHKNDLAVIASGQPMEAEEIVPSPTGEMHVWNVYKFPFKDVTGEQMVGGIAVDITSRKKAEEEFRQQSEDAMKLNQLTIGRELKMSELKEEIDRLKHQLEAVGK